MAHVKVYCKKSKTKPNGLAPIYFVIRINNKEKRKRETGKIQGTKLNNLGKEVERHRKIMETAKTNSLNL